LCACQLWRLASNFCFFDYFGLNFLFHMYFVVRHCRMLEESFYRDRIADFVYLWLFGAVTLTLVNLSVYLLADVSDLVPPPLMFLGPSLAFVILYIWARRNPNSRMSFLGLFDFDAPYLPWVLMGFGFLIGNSPYNDLLGIVVGHLYYFLADVYPAQTNRRPLRTPTWLKALCGELPRQQPTPRVANARPPAAAAPAAAPRQPADQRRDGQNVDNGNGVVMHEHDD
jgi:Derlin-2/3